MIVVEGPDNSGKSTLVKTLVERGYPLIKRERFKPGNEETIGLSYLKALIPKDGDRLEHSHGVLDRLLASEIIYGQMFRGRSRVTGGEHLAIINMLIAYNASIIFCDPGDAIIKETWHEREQLYDDALAIAKSYRSSMSRIFHPMLVIEYNWKKHAKNAKTFRPAETRDRDLEWWSANPHGCGTLTPRVLMVGESPSPRMKTSVPFSNGPAGDFLAWSIQEAEKMMSKPLIGRYYVTNAQKGTERDASLLREEIRFLEPQVVLALGNEAEELVKSVCKKKPHVMLPHPQFWKRFRYQQKERYPTMLASLLREYL